MLGHPNGVWMKRKANKERKQTSLTDNEEEFTKKASRKKSTETRIIRCFYTSAFSTSKKSWIDPSSSPLITMKAFFCPTVRVCPLLPRRRVLCRAEKSKNAPVVDYYDVLQVDFDATGKFITLWFNVWSECSW